MADTGAGVAESCSMEPYWHTRLRRAVERLRGAGALSVMRAVAPPRDRERIGRLPTEPGDPR